MDIYGQRSSRDYRSKACADSEVFASSGTLSSHPLSSSTFSSPSLAPPSLLTSNPYLHVADRRCRYSRLSYFANLIHKCYALWHPLDEVEHFEQLYFPFLADRENGHKTFHGVVCISYFWFTSYLRLPHPCFNSTLHWNPTIHKYVALPCLRLSDCYYAIGFGYDTSRNDFKVVLILIESRTYQVYSDRQGLWKTSVADGIKLESYWHFMGHDRPIFVNGTIHWILLSQALIIDKGSTMAPVTDMWVMEEHGVSTSWKKLYILGTTDGIIICDPTFEKLSPYGPNNPWNKYNGGFNMYLKYIDRVYDETMFFDGSSRSSILHKQGDSYYLN